MSFTAIDPKFFNMINNYADSICHDEADRVFFDAQPGDIHLNNPAGSASQLKDEAQSIRKIFRTIFLSLCRS